MSRLTTDQLALQDAARDLAETAFKPTAAATDLSEAYPWDNVATLRDSGFMGMTIPTRWRPRAKLHGQFTGHRRDGALLFDHGPDHG